MLGKNTIIFRFSTVNQDSLMSLLNRKIKDHICFRNCQYIDKIFASSPSNTKKNIKEVSNWEAQKFFSKIIVALSKHRD